MPPLGIFPNTYQPKLQELFRRPATPIDFGYGYRWRRNESNLLLAVRTDAAVTGSAEPPRNPDPGSGASRSGALPSRQVPLGIDPDHLGESTAGAPNCICTLPLVSLTIGLWGPLVEIPAC